MMINSICLNRMKYVSVLMLLLAAEVPCQSKSDYAYSLMKERDYFRAISVYKELSFFSVNNDSSIFYLSQIGKAYRLSQKYELSVAAYSSLLNRFAVSDSVNSSIYINLGLNYLGMNVPAQAISYLEEADKKDPSGLASLYLGLVYAEMSNWEKAKLSISAKENTGAAGILPEIRKEFSSTLSLADKLPHRDPLTASLLSAVIPGAGQFYCNHYVDALQAFGFVTAFSAATYIAYRNDKHYSSNYVLTGLSLSITGLFHIANIVGAERTATYFNQRQQEILLQDVRQKALNIDF